MPDSARSPIDLVRGLEERAFNAWPALETRLVSGWLMRCSNGFTKRANSVNAWRPDVPLADVVGPASAFYSSRGLPVIARLTPLADANADALLAAQGYSPADETIVMTTSLSDAELAPDPGVTITTSPGPQWLEGFANANGIADSRRAIHDEMVGRIDAPAAFARLSIDGRSAAWGIAAVERGFVGLFDIVTAPDVRRQGAARRLVGHMLHWARNESATLGYLQVVATNAPAIALYRRFGFAECYRYHYRIAAT